MSATSVYLWVPLIVAFAVAFIATPVSIKVAPKIGAMDVPQDDRRMHNSSMPRFGGSAIFLGIMVSLILFARDQEDMMSAMLGCCMIFLVGFIDDLKGLRARTKLLGQIIAAVIVYATGLRIEFVTNYFTGEGHMILGGAAGFILTVLWLVSITNAVNLIDGLDGLAAGTCIISAFCIAYVSYIHGQYIATISMMIIAGAALGFFPYNFHPAKTFMGDCGSQLLGFSIAAFSIIGTVKGATMLVVLIPALVLGLPIFDTAFAIVRRVANHQPIGEGDKEHLHHRIMRAGFGQIRSVMLMYCLSGIMGVVAVLYSRGLMVESFGLVFIAVMLLYVILSETSGRNTKARGKKISRREDEQER